MPGMLGRMSLGERIGFSGNRFEKSLMTKLDGRWNAGTVPDVVEYGSNKHSHAKARRRKGIQQNFLCVFAPWRETFRRGGPFFVPVIVAA
jgi:hypothetical protein